MYSTNALLHTVTYCVMRATYMYKLKPPTCLYVNYAGNDFSYLLLFQLLIVIIAEFPNPPARLCTMFISNAAYEAWYRLLFP